MRPINPSKIKERGALLISSRMTALVSLEAKDGGYRLAGLEEFQLGSHIKEASVTPPTAPEPAFKSRAADLISGRALFMKMVKLPRMTKKEAIKTLVITQKESIPFSLKEAFYDVWILNEEDSSLSMDALMVAVRNEDIDSHFEKFHGATLGPGAISIIPAAISALIGASDTIDTSSPTLFLDLGENVTGLHIFKNGRLIFTREIPFGVCEITKSLLRADLPDSAIAIDSAEAIAIIEDGGAPIEGEWNSQRLPLPLAEKYILPPMEKIAREIRRTIEYFTHNRGAQNISRCHIVGCGAIIKGMPAYIADRIGIPCAPYNPLDDFLSAKPAVEAGKEKIGPLIAIAVGLAIDNGERVDLVRNKPVAPGISRWGISPRAAVASLVFTIICLGLIWGGTGFYKINARIDKSTAEVKALKSLLGKNDYSNERLKTITRQIAALERALSSYPESYSAGYDWVGFFKEISRLTPGKIALTRLTVDFSNGNGDRPGYGAATIEGDVKGANKEKLIAISELIYKIKRSPFFVSAQIKGTSGKSMEKGNDDLTQFKVSAILDQGSSMMARSTGEKNGQGS